MRGRSFGWHDPVISKQGGVSIGVVLRGHYPGKRLATKIKTFFGGEIVLLRTVFSGGIS
jgi:hypothetical protein